MGLKIKKFNDILRDMAVWVANRNSSLTNMRVGGVTRTLLEAVSAEIESIYYEARRGYTYASENSIYNSFEFERIPALPASGKITVSFGRALNDPYLVPKGSQFFTIPIGGMVLYFTSTIDASAPRGATSLDVTVECDTPGVIGNVPPYSIRKMVGYSSLVQDVYNSGTFFNGSPEETKEDRKKRFAGYISSLSRGTTPSIEYACLRIPGVTGVAVEEKIGMIHIYAHDRNGDLSVSQIQGIKDIMPEYKCAGIKANISIATPKKINLSLVVTIQKGYDGDSYMQIVSSSVRAFLDNYRVGTPLRRASLIQFIMSIDPNVILNVELGLPSDIDTQPYELIRPGNVSVEILE